MGGHIVTAAEAAQKSAAAAAAAQAKRIHASMQGRMLHVHGTAAAPVLVNPTQHNQPNLMNIDEESGGEEEKEDEQEEKQEEDKEEEEEG